MVAHTMTALAETAPSPAGTSAGIPSVADVGGLEVVSIAKSYDKRAVLSDISSAAIRSRAARSSANSAGAALRRARNKSTSTFH
jgi:hypothetical protein